MRIRNYFAIAGGIAMLIGLLMVTAPKSQAVSADKSNVMVVNTAEEPALTRDTDNPARQPFQRQAAGAFGDGAFQGCFSMSVPDNKMLVMENVSANVVVPSGQGVLNLRVLSDIGDGFEIAHFFVPTSVGTGGVSSFFVVGQTTRLYAKGGLGDVQVCVTRNSSTGVASLNAAISGYLVDLP